MSSVVEIPPLLDVHMIQLDLLYVWYHAALYRKVFPRPVMDWLEATSSALFEEVEDLEDWRMEMEIRTLADVLPTSMHMCFDLSP